MDRYFDAEKGRFASEKISREMPEEYQTFMWLLIDGLRMEYAGKMDYLQVFEFSVKWEDGRLHQMVEHRQEEPEYREEYCLECIGSGIADKVYVVGYGDHCTMMWAMEY